MPGFSHPVWLIGLLGVPVLAWLRHLALTRRRTAALEFSHTAFLKATAETERTPWRPRLLALCTFLILSLVLVGLADPHLSLEQTREGLSAVLVIDSSGSMAATDYAPSRLEAAKQAAGVLIRALDRKDYVGVVTFEEGASSAAYLSPDRERVLAKVAAIGARTGRTALGDGLALGIDMADAIPNRKKVVILLSDGVSNAGMISPGDATRLAVERHVQVFTVGLGSVSPVLIGYSPFGEAEYATLDETTLRTIAASTSGHYFRSVDSATLKEIYAEIPSSIERVDEETSVQRLFFALVLPVILLEFWLRYGTGRILS
ncbi:MAG: VWA domain-containing protein [Methanospirillum sp.]|nr:VWA domain-containing protein [Methanospirillum sp.]